METTFDAEAPASDLIDLNIVPQEYRRRVISAGSWARWVLAFAAIALAVQLSVLLILQSGRVATLEAELARVSSALASSNPTGAEAAELRAALAQTLSAIEDIEAHYEEAMPDRRDWAGAFRAIREAVPGTIALTSVRQTYGQITLAGTADDDASVLALKSNLESSGFFSSVTIVSMVALPTPTPTPTPIPTATPTPVPTNTPTPTPTSIPAPTATPMWFISFWADTANIDEGECTELYWDVGWVKAVYLDGEGVVGHGSREVCPVRSKTYTLRVIKMDDSVEALRITINVTEAESESPTESSVSSAATCGAVTGKPVAGLATLRDSNDGAALVSAVADSCIRQSARLSWSPAPSALVDALPHPAIQGASDGLTAAGVEFEMLLEVHPDSGTE